jgi:hypothetical protein
VYLSLKGNPDYWMKIWSNCKIFHFNIFRANCSVSSKKMCQNNIYHSKFFLEKPLCKVKLTFLKSRFFPAKILFSKIQKKNLAGKYLLCKGTRSILFYSGFQFILHLIVTKSSKNYVFYSKNWSFLKIIFNLTNFVAIGVFQLFHNMLPLIEV